MIGDGGEEGMGVRAHVALMHHYPPYTLPLSFSPSPPSLSFSNFSLPSLSLESWGLPFFWKISNEISALGAAGAFFTKSPPSFRDPTREELDGIP